ncbi:MAG: TTC39/IML2 family protein, partial [Ignavibacteria bacterium]|nr:TTC39/IML2 family protein [Ignavibacteria bacterium]
MKYIFIVLTIVLTMNLNKAQSETNSNKHSDISSIDSEVLEGLDDIYNLQFDNAESKFKKLQKSNPNDLRGFFYESLIYFYKALPTRDEESYNKYIELTETVIDKAEKLLEKNEIDYDAMYYKGLSHSYVSLLMLSLNKNLLKAASNGNDGYRILSTLTEKKPDYYDAYMGLGLYKIAIGFVPEKFQWLLSMIGFDGNINEGINYLKKSLTNGRYTKT